MDRAVRLFVLTATALCAALTAGPLPADDPARGEQPTVTWQVESSHNVLGTNDSTFYARIRVKAAAVETKRQPLNLALVFDRSGSMKEEAKIGYLRQAGHLVVDNLTKPDHVALVAYNHEVQTLAPLHSVVNREYLHHRIDELYADGYTNLSGGLMEGCAQLHGRLDQQGLHHVILLTDGLANRGVTDPGALVRLVERCTQRGISVSTIGVGTEYNEALLSRVADAGGGRYVHVAKPDEIPSAFEKELGALLAVVAQNAKLNIGLPAGVEPMQVFGRDEPLKPDKLELTLGDLASGEERVLLVKFAVRSGAAGSGTLALSGSLTYDDISSAERIKEEQAVNIERAAAATAEPGPVLAYARLVEAVDKIALAVQGMDYRLAAEVQQIQRRDFPQLKQVAWSSRDQDFVNKAFMFEHYARELQDLIERGALHEHSRQRAALQKELHYRRYLMEHHRDDHRH
ncbi:MAG: VWA domain-containing protein [Planctomycetes bacterium]|nr:VWA domain-containing protein [Planctomycetia bacterium]MBI3468495.1 VWA domain-containing protein [Planctomycetota bacterium]